MGQLQSSVRACFCVYRDNAGYSLTIENLPWAGFDGGKLHETYATSRQSTTLPLQ